MVVQKNFILLAIGVVLLAMAVKGSTATSNKAVESLCQLTDYKQSCLKSLAHVNNTNDPKKLVKMVLKSAIKEIHNAMDSSYTLQGLAKHHRTYMALAQCNEALYTSIDDIKRSIKKLDHFDATNVEEYVGDDIKIWLSGSLTYQETCRDGFLNTTGEAGEEMNTLLSLGWELTSNGLAMVNDFLDMSLGIDEWWARGVGRMLLDVGSKSWTHKFVIVAQDGSGSFSTIMDAVRTIPKRNNKPFLVYIKQGIYKEHVEIPRHVNCVAFVGEGPNRTKITGSVSHNDGTPTFKTATVAVNGELFFAKDIGFENTAGPERYQAVALRVSADKAIFHNCAMDGYQDTLYTHSYRQFYRGCNISGTIDFVFGDAAAVFQNCKMIVKKPLANQECMVTAQGRKDRHSKGALILQGCIITADQEFLATTPMPKSYLGRPWKVFSRTIIMQSFIDRNIAPEGWSPWPGKFGLDTCYYGEFDNRGPSADTAQRATGKCIKKISLEVAVSYTPKKYIQGDLWIKATGIPYDPQFMNNVI
ncbi:pectinesterase-like [Bidens hawaiensis]|uniref:pectinesterase-like n=1 Tax=Bidens hawaiensis TaxID=980011 RepID=UPI00404ACA60